MSKKNISEAKTLEQYRVTFENTELQPQIASTMAEYGYDPATIAVGKELYDKVRLAYATNKNETDETFAAYAAFENKRKQLNDIYSAHRKRAKVVFREDPVTANKLGIAGAMPKAYLSWLETISKFYDKTTTDVALQTQLSQLKITLDELNAAKALLPEVESLRAVYLKEKGESQDATTIKDIAFAKLDDWMRKFYAVAKIALEDNPQLLEAFGKTIKS